MPWIIERATDMLRGDVAVKGGITTLIKTAHLAEAFRMNFEVHHGGNSLNNVANLHVIMAIRNTEFFEVLLPDAMQKYGLAEEIVVDGDGYVHAPTGPGLGAADRFRPDRAEENRGAELAAQQPAEEPRQLAHRRAAGAGLGVGVVVGVGVDVVGVDARRPRRG